MRTNDDGSVEILSAPPSEDELVKDFPKFVVKSDCAVTSDCFAGNVITKLYKFEIIPNVVLYLIRPLENFTRES